jgi:urease accessory protein
MAAALFGLFHGHAHGTEIPALAAPVLYAAGFVASTIALHVTGVLVGRIAVASTRGQTALRMSGAAIAAAGIFFLIG